jgi:hypothetical protein
MAAIIAPAGRMIGCPSLATVHWWNNIAKDLCAQETLIRVSGKLPNLLAVEPSRRDSLPPLGDCQCDLVSLKELNVYQRGRRSWRRRSRVVGRPAPRGR